MNLKQAHEVVDSCIGHKQNPDKVTYTKQWDEFGALKGWMVGCEWNGGQQITFDITSHYQRIIGNLDEVPDYQPGVHQK